MIWLRFQFGPQIGMGHAVRCLTLARALGEAGGEVGLLLDDDAPDLPGAKDFPVYPVAPDGSWPDTGGILFDVSHARTGDTLSRSIKALTRKGRKCAVIDGLGTNAYTDSPKANLVLSPYLVPPGTPARSGKSCLEGPQYAILGAEYADEPPELSGRKSRLLITIGGSDPWALTETALDAAHGALTLPRFDITVIAGPRLDTKRRSHLAARCRKLEVELLDAPSSLRDVLCASAVAILGPGLTKYEAAACNTPAVILAPDEETRTVNRPFAEAGLAYLLDAGQRNFAGELGAALGTQAARKRSSWSGRKIVDGQGAARSAAAIREALGE
ncbi:hypothetical protein [Hyphobacterium marinum]|uniref:Glycosyl transferase family 28 C-terminal domain-containing protein n=1 Tax=Hyphobacterium marinum TaxID=3116574 RepID=A0ABU7M005_9PROT|nr:hypothetical protein [Hyphobacterium sp. Y6023]MEE2567031.1 hypothetical protein [Hyphobacterium sp. Y6023]